MADSSTFDLKEAFQTREKDLIKAINDSGEGQKASLPLIKKQAELLAAADKRANKEAAKKEKHESEARANEERNNQILDGLHGMAHAAEKFRQKAEKFKQVAAGKIKDWGAAQLAKVKDFSKSMLSMLMKGLGLAALWAIFKLIEGTNWEKILDDVGFWIDAIFVAITRFGAWLGLAKFRAWMAGEGPMVSFMQKIKNIFKAEGFMGKIISKIKMFFSGKGGKLSQKLGKITESIKNLFKEEGFFGKIIAKIKTFFSGKGGKLSQRLNKITTSIANLFKEEGFLGKIIAKIKNFFGGKTGRMGKLMTKIGGWFTSIGGIAGKVSGLSKVMGFVKGAAKFLGKIFVPVTILMALWEAISGFMTGFENTEGNFFQKILGGIGGAVKGLLDFFIFSIAEMIQDVIVWVGEFFGFDMSAVVDFDLVGKIKTSVFKVIDYVVDLFSFKDTSALGIFGSLIDIVFLPLNMAINFVKNLFGWGDSEKPFSLSGFIFGMLDKVWKWITEELLVNPVDALTNLITGLLGGYVGFLDWMLAMIKKPVVWLLEMFGWDDAAESVDKFTLKGFIAKTWTKVKAWFLGLLSWASDEKEDDSIVVKYAKKAINAVKEWFGKMFKFDSGSDIIASIINVLTWLPNLVKDGIAAVTTWLLKLFGFDEAAEKVANANKFSIGEMVMNAITGIVEWLEKLFDIDIGMILSNVMGALGDAGKKVLGWLGFGDEEPKPGKTGAGGGPVGKDEPILVGELGPELFVPSGSGRLLPKAQTETAFGGGGGGAPTIVNAPTTVNNGGGTSTMVVASSSINPMHNKYFRN